MAQLVFELANYVRYPLRHEDCPCPACHYGKILIASTIITFPS